MLLTTVFPATVTDQNLTYTQAASQVATVIGDSAISVDERLKVVAGTFKVMGVIADQQEEKNKILQAKLVKVEKQNKQLRKQLEQKNQPQKMDQQTTQTPTTFYEYLANVIEAASKGLAILEAHLETARKNAIEQEEKEYNDQILQLSSQISQDNPAMSRNDVRNLAKKTLDQRISEAAQKKYEENEKSAQLFTSFY